MTNQTIAKTILAQFGGREFLLVTGSKNLVATENGLHFKVGRNGKKVTHVRVTLDDNDTYTVEFCKWNGRKLEMNVISKHEGIYCDMLKDLFYDNTGMYCTFR